MKTLSQYPGLIGRLVAGHEQREQRRKWPFCKRAAWTVRWICSGAFEWILWPFVKFIAVPLLIGISIAATLCLIFLR